MLNNFIKMCCRYSFKYPIFFFIVILIIGAMTSVSAQDNDDMASIDDGDGKVEKRMTPSEQMRWIKEMKVSAEQLVKSIGEKLENAKNEKDTLRITCLDDKLTQLDVTVSGITERTKSLETSIKQGNTIAAEQNFAILRIYVERIFKLSEASENCLGEADVVLGKTKTSTTIDPNISAYDPDDSNEIFYVEIGTAPPNELSGHL